VPRQEDPHHFLDLMFGYYLTSRFAMLNSLHVAPQLAHHAVELLIKFTLLKDVSNEEMTTEARRLKRDFGHDLDKLWPAYKEKVAPADLGRFDGAIAALNRWERLRYGGFPEGKPVQRSFGPVRPAVSSASDDQDWDVYDFGLQEIDDLIRSMLEASHVNPAFVGMAYANVATLRQVYFRDNDHVMADLLGPAPGGGSSDGPESAA
jgi:hypothetical protein